MTAGLGTPLPGIAFVQSYAIFAKGKQERRGSQKAVGKVHCCRLQRPANPFWANADLGEDDGGRP